MADPTSSDPSSAGSKTSLFKRMVWRLEVLAYDCLCLMLLPFKFDHVSAFGGWVFRHIGPLTRKHHIARTGLRIAFPEASDAQIRRWLDAQWDNTGRTFAEFPLLHRLRVFAPDSRVSIQGLEHLEALRDSGKLAVIITGHFSNWEVMAAVLSQSGLPVRITYRRINNPYFDARVRKQREAYGTKFLVPKSGPRGARQLLDALQSGESVALLNDQKFNQGLSLPFFGEPAMTAPGPARLALKANIPVLFLSLTRDKAHFHMRVHPPVTLKTTGDRSQDTLEAVKSINQFIEDRIREHPDQWFWVHRRWPKPLYKSSLQENDSSR